MSSIIFEKAIRRISSRKINEIRLSVEIVERIYDIMEKYAMNPKILAQKLGKQPSEINEWLSGMHNFTSETISQLESIFGESILSVAQKNAEMGGHSLANEPVSDSGIKDNLTKIEGISPKTTQLLNEAA